jgi:hypothetical protein
MKQITTLGLSLALAIGFATAASAQTTSSSAGNLTTATTSTSTTSTSTTSSTSTTAAKKPTSATAEMVNEAIQRSQARAAKELETGRAQQWGSEEPFVYNPAVRNFNTNQQ